MEDISLFNTVVLYSPVIVSIATALMMLMDINEHRGRSNKPQYLLFGYFIIVFLCWFIGIFYYYKPAIFVYCNALFLLAPILYSLILYAFTFEITRLDPNEKFSRGHFIMPILLTLAMVISSLFIPFQEQLDIVLARGAYPGGNYWYFLFFTSKMCIAIAFLLIYITLILLRLKKYHRAVEDYSSNLERTSLQWLFYSALLYGLITSLLMLISRNILISSAWGVLPVILVTLVDVQLCYNTIKENFVPIDDLQIFQEECIKEKFEKSPEDLSEIYTKIQSRFKEVVIDEKCYKNPDLKITDLVDKLYVNRSYISAFINQEYSMNFSRYINQLRLEEFDRLRQSEENSNKSNEQLAELSGFGSYRTYLRTSRKES